MHNIPLIFTPLIPLALLEALAAAAALLAVYAILRRARGGWVRAVLFSLLLLALANPSFIREQRAPLKDTALVVIDESASMKLGDRAAQSAAAAQDVTKKLAAFSDLDVETLHMQGTGETDLFRALEQKLAAVPSDRLAGIIAITDGEIHDKPDARSAAPFHVLLAGQHDEIDRRVVIAQAPAYGIVGKKARLTVRVEDQPRAQSETAIVRLRRDDGGSETVTAPINQDVSFDVPIAHAGQNLFMFSVEPLPRELTTINNASAVTVSGIRDRLRVLLVSSQPHIGERTWRNFLKSDPAVDLVHFTILRPPGKQSGAPNNELSLITFPVHELFETKLKDFDLIILDRFQSQSLIADAYLDNIARYVEDGGALLVSNATGDDNPLPAFSPLARILPAAPTGKILTGAFVPDLTEDGRRHPVTNALAVNGTRDDWGRWFRQAEAGAVKGNTLLTGLNRQPLLILDHVGKGRVAQFLSDQFWLWSRGFEGGGPQAELLRRTAHWLVQEPDLDETALRAHAELTDSGWQLVITKQSLRDASADATVTGPDEQVSHVTLAPGEQAGILRAVLPVSQTGLYRVKSGAQEVLAMAGPANAPEFGDMRATGEKLAPVAEASSGAINWLVDHPAGLEIRRTQAGGAQQGWNWIGLRKNGQYRVTGSETYPLLPPLLAVAVLLAVLMGVWRREGK